MLKIKPNILVTGSSGFLGSHTIAHLSKNYRICGIDKRFPSKDQLKKFANIDFINLDISNTNELNKVINNQIDKYGNFDYIIHLAAEWSYSVKLAEQYHDINMKALNNVIELSSKHHIKRILYSSSITALKEDKVLDEKTSLITEKTHPYGWSKAHGEKTIQSSNVNSAILRITGVYSDFSELPPLTWLINRWTKPHILSRIIPGNGLTSMSYLHINDFTNLIELIISNDLNIGNKETFLVGTNGAISQNKLFEIIRNDFNLSNNPIYFPKDLVKLGLIGEKLTFQNPPEPLWMLNYIGKQLVTDSTYTQNKLSWQISNKSDIESYLPCLLNNYKNNQEKWKIKQLLRETHKHEYII